jgi:hypothetical protein
MAQEHQSAHGGNVAFRNWGVQGISAQVNPLVRRLQIT